TILDIGQQLLHRSAGLIVDDLWTSNIIAPLSGVRNRVTHVVQATLVEQVYDQLQLVHTLEVSNLWLVASVNQGLETGLNQSRNATTKNCLLTEQVSLGLLSEGGGQNTST